MCFNRSPLNPGDMVASVYQVEHMLGIGAMGVVVAARHIWDGSRVAIKCVLPEHATSPDLISRFQLEAYLGSSLRSEHVVRVLHVGTLDLSALKEGNAGCGVDLPYMVMQHLEGVDLGVLLSQRTRIDPYAAAKYMVQACAALAEAHALGFVHRDIKPGNLFLTKRAGGIELIKVLDFGIAKPPRSSRAGHLALTAHELYGA
jgi:eukaryotic-like serine/threonine-protein kinase